MSAVRPAPWILPQESGAQLGEEKQRLYPGVVPHGKWTPAAKGK